MGLWGQVAERVGTRTADECAEQWFSKFDQPTSTAAADAAATAATSTSSARAGRGRRDGRTARGAGGGGKRPTKRQLAEEHAAVESDDIFNPSPGQPSNKRRRHTASTSTSPLRTSPPPEPHFAEMEEVWVHRPTKKQLRDLGRQARRVILAKRRHPRAAFADDGGAASATAAVRGAKKGATLSRSVGSKYTARGTLAPNGTTGTVAVRLHSDAEAEEEEEEEGEEDEEVEEEEEDSDEETWSEGS